VTTATAFRTSQEDASCWERFALRPDDIIISSRAKSGTTWVQYIVALLVFGENWPGPLHEVSPWLGKSWGDTAIAISALESQRHRRFIKSHVPLHMLPAACTRIVVVRNPIDVAVSTYYHRRNLRSSSLDMTVARWMHMYVTDDQETDKFTESLGVTLDGIAYAWEHRSDPGVVLVRYEDLLADREGEIRRIGSALGYEADDDTWTALAEVTSFSRMQSQLQLVPEAAGFSDPSRFFRHGRRGDGVRLASARDYQAYRDRLSALPDGCAKWLTA
jgi:aryl sulfotransferase